MKKPFSFKFKESEVKEWKLYGKKENRSLTNFIETVMNNYVAEKKIQSKK